MSEKKSKIVMITMFKNEAPVIKRMLDSCLPYIDYYVMQDNGSTDGTTDIAKQFLIDNKLSGEIYFCEEGWKGFGWNRDHLIQYCQNKTNHECDWILKMDCDEILEVDSDFDWSPLDNKEIQAFHIPIKAGTAYYYRAWMYNAKLPWRFNHDLCHETVYCELPEIGLNFGRYDLNTKFRHIGFNEGQSWSNPTKFISDALKLEEELISKGTMTDNLYHFWYIGKSYLDSYQSNSFPLGESQKKEFARRAIYYFEEFVNFIQKMRGGKIEIDETNYLSLNYAGECYKFLGEINSAITSYYMSEQFAPERNDHLFALAEIYKNKNDYEKMFEITSKMMQPERTNPFPKYCNFIDSALYHDSPLQRVQNLHEMAKSKQKPKEIGLPLSFNRNRNKKLFIVDNFYTNPDEVRSFALQQEFKEDLRWYKGFRTVNSYSPKGIKQAFENIIGESIREWGEGSPNGCFQVTTSKDPQVYHYDTQRWAAMIYLTPNAPIESGTRLHRSKITGLRHKSEEGIDFSFNGGFYDSTKFDVVDSAANIYNRLVIMDAQCIHSAGPYFGQSMEDGRLVHLFFFD